MPDPHDGASVDVRQVTVGFDGSPDAIAALDWAVDIAGVGAACEVAIAVGDAPAFPLGPSTGATIAADVAVPARLQAVVEDACRPLRRKGLPYRVTVRRGEPAPTIEGIAAAGQADLLVLGSSGEGLDGDPLAGSVSRTTAHQRRAAPSSSCPAPTPTAPTGRRRHRW